jgi:hypothetical protein
MQKVPLDKAGGGAVAGASGAQRRDSARARRARYSLLLALLVLVQKVQKLTRRKALPHELLRKLGARLEQLGVFHLLALLVQKYKKLTRRIFFFRRASAQARCASRATRRATEGRRGGWSRRGERA